MLLCDPAVRRPLRKLAKQSQRECQGVNSRSSTVRFTASAGMTYYGLFLAYPSSGHSFVKG